MPDKVVLSHRRPFKEPPLSLRDVLAVFFRQRRLFLISFAGILTAALCYTFWSTPYRADMKVLVRRTRLDPPMSAQPSERAEFARDDITEEELNSEVELLKNFEILRKVVLATNLAAPPSDWLGRWRREDEEVRLARAVRRLAKRLQVEPIRKTRMIAVTYHSSDPALAARVLSSLASVYMEKHLEVQRPSGEFRFFEQQAEEYARQLDAAESKLLDLNNKGVVAASLERDLALQKLSEAEANYRQIPVAISETEQRIRQLKAQLQSLPERTTTQVSTADNQQLLQHLKSTLLTLQLKRTELLTKFQPTYRLVQEVDQQIAETREAITAEQSAPARQETTDRDPNRAWAEAELQKSQVELDALTARAAAAGSVVLHYGEAVRKLGRDSLEQQDLARNAKVAEENYLLYVRKREEARIGDALDQRGILNVAIVQEPRIPALPERSPLTTAIAGFLAACVISTSLAFTFDYLDPSFRTPREITGLLNAPVLASLPRDLAPAFPSTFPVRKRATDQ
jgi:uncharacterized protein involved in exopolysaccharide biosynthesis